MSASPVNVAIKCLLKYKCLWTVFILLCHHRCDRWRRQEHFGQESKRKNLIFPWGGQLGTVNVLSAIFLLLTLCVVLKNNNPVSNVCIYLLVLLCVATTVPSCAWNDEEWNITVQSFCLYEEHLAQRMCGQYTSVMYKMVILLVTFLISKLQGFCLIRVTNFKDKLEKEKLNVSWKVNLLACKWTVFVS